MSVGECGEKWDGGVKEENKTWKREREKNDPISKKVR
jgi:hypothetical protein